jgi:hypothetical protein
MRPHTPVAKPGWLYRTRVLQQKYYCSTTLVLHDTAHARIKGEKKGYGYLYRMRDSRYRLVLDDTAHARIQEEERYMIAEIFLSLSFIWISI